MKTLTLILFLFTGNYLSANRIEIYLSLNNCNTCYAALGALNQLPNYEKLFILCKQDSLVIKEFLENYEIPKESKFKYVAEKNDRGSFCKVFTNEELYSEFELMDLPKKVTDLSVLGMPEFQLYRIDKLNINKERCELFVRNNTISIQDYTLNKVLISKLSVQTGTAETGELKGNLFQPKQFLSAGQFDTAAYQILSPTLKKIGKGYPSIESAYLSDSTVYLLLNFPYAQPIPGDTAIDMSFFIYARNLRTNEKKLTYLQHLVPVGKEEYLINNSMPFFVENKEIYISGYNATRFAKTNKLNCRLFRCDYTKSEYRMKDLVSLHYDEFGDTLPFRVNEQFYFNSALTVVYDHTHSKNISVKNLTLRPTDEVIDLKLTGHTLSILSVSNKQNYLIEYDLQNQTQIKCSLVLAPPRSIQYTFRFFDKDRLVFLNPDQSGICSMQIDNH